jgi:tRNA modification GTPase
VSARTGAGLDALRARLAAEAARLASPGDAPALTRARHRAALEQAVRHLADADTSRWADQRAEDLRLALRCLGRITGEVGVESVLDEVFSSFCIGK